MERLEKRRDNARPAIQKAIDAAAAAKGGAVYLPPGDYTSGTLRLRSHVNIYIESGATLFASEDPAAFDCKRSSRRTHCSLAKTSRILRLEAVARWTGSEVFLGAGHD